MSHKFLGVGWKYPVGLDETGRIEMSQYEESIRDAIWIILGTSQGERMMHPDFGCGIHDLVFEVNNAATAGRVVSAVRDALINWEPRIDVLDVQATPKGSGEILLIRIDYRVRTTNNTFNLVYPYYLERSTS